MNLRNMTKAQLIEHINKLKVEHSKCETAEPDYYRRHDEHWYAVAFYGWGSWEEDVYFIEENSIEEAIISFFDAIDTGEFCGYGSDNYDNRVPYGHDNPTLIVYSIADLGNWVPETHIIRWKRNNG